MQSIVQSIRQGAHRIKRIKDNYVVVALFDRSYGDVDYILPKGEKLVTANALIRAANQHRRANGQAEGFVVVGDTVPVSVLKAFDYAILSSGEDFVVKALASKELKADQVRSHRFVSQNEKALAKAGFRI